MAGAKKPRLPLHQMIFFSVGNVMNDLCNAIYTSYLLTFQTKVLGLPNNIVGLLWLVPAGVDAMLSLIIGYVSDNVSIPYMSRFYGRRKSWHLLGCTLVGICSPFILMPCFLCSDNTAGWKTVIYYGTFQVLAYAGWGLTQSNVLALIPVIAKRQSEMVKLGAINSAITLICGMFVYIAIWILLGSDNSETISFSSWKKFMYLVVIVVGTGAFFSAIFHFGTREPTKELKEPKRSSHHKSSPHTAHQFSKDEYCDATDTHVANQLSKGSTHAHNVSDVIQGLKDTALVNPSFEDDEHINLNLTTNEKDFKHKEIAKLDVTELEAVLWKALSEKNEQQTDETSSIESGGYYDDGNGEETTSGESSDCEMIELPMPGTFMDMVPHVSELILHSHRGSNRSSPMPSPRLSRAASRRSRASSQIQNEHLYNVVLRSRLNSTSSRVSPMATPRLCRSTSNRFIPPFESLPQQNSSFPFDLSQTSFDMNPIPSTNTHVTLDTKPHRYEKEHDNITTKEHHSLSVIEEITEPKKDELTIIDRSQQQTNSVQPQNSWKTVFKKPEFYKLGAAYMFTRVCQNVTTSYLPLFLTDYLKFGKEAIAYFPLVILLSGVFASFAAKKFNKNLGNKWTFCLGSIMVMGASGWFYLLTPENRSVMYVPAILTGCGTSIMFVTTLALAADLINADRSSGAFMIASMTVLCKIVFGVLFFLLQEYSPKASGSNNSEWPDYIHHVFSLTPGVSAFFGLIAFILFIPATIQCKPITHTAEAETQTVEFQLDEEPRHTNHLEVIIENEKEPTPSPVMVNAETQTATHDDVHNYLIEEITDIEHCQAAMDRTQSHKDLDICNTRL